MRDISLTPRSFSCLVGLICDRGLTLGHLIGVLNQFFSRLGMPKLRFKPAYNPYTEPSMEIFSYSEQLKKWMEVGMFRTSRDEGRCVAGAGLSKMCGVCG